MLSKLTLPQLEGCTVSRIGIFKCDVNKTAHIGILWLKPNNGYIFEGVHGRVADLENDPEKLLIECRTRCVGTYISGPTAVMMWNKFVTIRSLGMSRKVFTVNFNIV